MTEQVQTTCKRERRIRDIKIIATFPGDDRRYHWETYHDDDGVLCCAGCGAIIVEGES